MNKRKNEIDIRKKGQFYTPKLFCDYAHDMIAKEFGEDWKEKYVVWDNSAGSKNLTRDYYFNELYSSTLENAELEISKNYNKEATSFQFDFLNDSLDKLPKGLIEAFEQNKPIIFFMNPPYATSCNMGVKNGTKGKNTTKTAISDLMVENKMGKCANSLYGQFLYRILLIKRKYNLTNCNICLFCSPLFLSGKEYAIFRDEFFKEFSYENGAMFNASEFDDVSNKWGISFTVWKNNSKITNNFKVVLIKSEEGEIVSFGEKNIYNKDKNEGLRKWYREGVSKKLIECPNMTSAIKIKENQTCETQPLAKISEDGFGYLFSNGDSVEYNMQFVSLFSSAFSVGKGSSITPMNFNRICAAFSARKLVEKTWINSKDEYMKPNTEHPMWKEFENDSIIYSLFHSASNQSSLRQIDYKGKKWDIKNEFFWMSKDEMKQLANDNNNDECYNDANVSNDRYVYTLLKDIELSPEAQAVLDKASDIVRKTFKYRQLFNEENESYQINNFDCGWYQIKALAKEYAKDDLEEFKTLYKKLSDKMLPMVYELGFLLDATIMY